MSAARQQMADNPELQTLMAGLRGSNAGARPQAPKLSAVEVPGAHGLRLLAPLLRPL